MKIKICLIAFFCAFLLGCKKDSVDGSSIKNFQSSVNDMTSSLTTIQQIKFNEALYIIKTFGIEGDNDIEKLKKMAQDLNGKKVPEILALADKIAQQNGVDWSSTGNPSLGEMNIFQSQNPSESDPNDIEANSLKIILREAEVDSVVGARAFVVVPRLLGADGKEVTFSNAALETVMEIYSQGKKIQTSKNLMQNNNFKGFYVKLSSLPKDQITEGKLEIKVLVKTSKKNFQMTKTGIQVNEAALFSIDQEGVEGTTNPETTDPSAVGNPRETVSKFLDNVSAQNLKSAYDLAENPNWGSYDNFANPNSGFGAVKSLKVKNISTSNNANNSATVTASYSVVDKDGNSTLLNVSYGLKNTPNGWKITSYNIVSSSKETTP